MTTKKLIKLLALYLPYILLGLVATNFGEAWRLAEGKELGDKIMSMIRRQAARSCTVSHRRVRQHRADSQSGKAGGHHPQP